MATDVMPLMLEVGTGAFVTLSVLTSPAPHPPLAVLFSITCMLPAPPVLFQLTVMLVTSTPLLTLG
ncbi:MAG: hypothetical protein O9350_19975, partial [Microcystis sp. LE19-388.1G]|nr:hypothetical protein [Microcystis sp. LE19-388.1G]